MRKLSLFIALIVLILLVVGGAIFLNRSKESTSSTTTETPKPTTTKENTMMSLSELLLKGKSQMCTYDYKDAQNGTVKGVVYISGGKVRADFTTTANGKPYSGSMINDTKYMYTWSSEAKTGFKTQISDMKQMMDQKSVSPTTTQQQSLDSNVKYDYKCADWVVDNSKFSPPSDIKFTDYSSMMKQMMKPTGTTSTSESNSAQCGACSYLSGDQKTACMSAYNCK